MARIATTSLTVSNQSQVEASTRVPLRQCLTLLKERAPAGVGASPQRTDGFDVLRYTESRTLLRAAHVCHL